MAKIFSFETKELITIGLVGALMFVLCFIFGSILNIATGNPGASAFITQIIQAILITILVVIFRKPGVATYMWLIYGILAIPTTLWGGLPGIYKVIMALVTGISFDTVVYLFKYKKWSFYLGGMVTYIIVIPLMIWFYYLLNVPGKEVALSLLPIMLVICVIEYVIGTFIGFKIYKKIENKQVIQNLK